jgi:hypothetical protein
MNKSLLLLERLPGSNWKFIYPNAIDIALMFLLLIAILILFEKKMSKMLVLSLALLVGFPTCGLMNQIKTQRERQFAVYAIPKSSLIAMIQNRKVFYYSPEPLRMDPIKSELMLRKLWSGKNIQPMEINKSSNSNQNLLIEKGKFKVVIVRNPKGLQFKKSGNVLVLSKKVKTRNYSELIDSSAFRYIVLDGSMSQWQRSQFKAIAHRKQIQNICWDVSEKGAFIVDL